MKRQYFLGYLLAALLALSTPAHAATVTSVRMYKSPEYTRVVFDLSEHVTYTVARLTNPDRVVVDLVATELSPRANIEPTSATSAPVLALRHSNQTNRDLRWVFDLAAAAKPKAFVLPPVAPHGHRLVVDLYPLATANDGPPANAQAHASNAGAPVSQSLPVPATSKSSTSGATATAAGAASAQQSQAPIAIPMPRAPDNITVAPPVSADSKPPAAVATAATTVAKPTPIEAGPPSAGVVPHGQEVVVAIDAGHGGEDPGAIGDDGVQEKDVVLAIARRLAELVSAQPGFRAVLIRDGDYYIPLALRPRKAREAGAHFFISVHADAHTNRTARGASVYALSERGATSETAKWLAQRENSSDLVGGVSLDDKDKLLAEVLLDLSMTASLAESLEMGSHVLGNLRGITKLHSRHVEQAGFRVLKSPDMPSILVETGYVSNAADAKQLGSAAYRTEIASAIFAGVRAQAMARPPRGTVFALRDREMRDHETKVRQTVVSTAAESRVASAPQLDREHRVEPGETLMRVAARFGVSQRALRRLNGLVGDSVVSGQVLRLPDRAAVDP